MRSVCWQVEAAVQEILATRTGYKPAPTTSKRGRSPQEKRGILPALIDTNRSMAAPRPSSAKLSARNQEKEIQEKHKFAAVKSAATNPSQLGNSLAWIVRNAADQYFAQSDNERAQSPNRTPSPPSMRMPPNKVITSLLQNALQIQI